MLSKAPKINFNNFLPPNKKRLGAGGLRLKGTYKRSEPDFPLLTVITVCFNSKKYLKNSIESVLNQTYSNIEYIIIDGGSDDGTLEIINKYEEKVDLWYSEPDCGIYDAFNKGLSLARGELISFCNSDDWLFQNSIETILEKYNKKPFDWICGSILAWHDEFQNNILKSDLKGLRFGMTLWQPGSFVKKEVFLKIGGFNPDFKIAGDYDFYLRMVNDCQFSGKISSETFSNYRLIGKSSNQVLQRELESLKVKNLHFNLTIINYLEFILKVLWGLIVKYKLRRFFPLKTVNTLKNSYFKKLNR